MPRLKAAPTRKRALAADEPMGTAAPEVIEQAEIPELIEQAEIERVHSRISSGVAKEIHDMQSPPVRGLGRISLSVEDLSALQAVHATIIRRLEDGDGSLARWGGLSDTSGRRRGYGYLPGNALAEAHFREGVIAMREYSGAAAVADAAANRRACVMLDASTDVPSGFLQALTNLTSGLASVLPPEYRSVLQPEALVAAQPNLHRGRVYLRPHLDEPLHDGFGIVIVTVAVRGDARILLHSRPWDTEHGAEYWFPLRQGQAYMLASDARNVCLHGVLADASPERESLNLRFGLHGISREEPFSAWAEVEQHWPQTALSGPASSTHDCA